MLKLPTQVFLETERKTINALRRADWWRIILLWALTECFRILISRL